MSDADCTPGRKPHSVATSKCCSQGTLPTIRLRLLQRILPLGSCCSDDMTEEEGCDAAVAAKDMV